jgi:hypothetical protein
MLAAGAAGLLIGLGIGLALGSGDDDSDPVQGLRDARSSFGRASDVLGIVTVEYAEGVENGRVVSEPEYRGARGAIARSRELYLEGRPVLAYADAPLATRIDHAYPRLAAKALARAPEREVESDARRLARTLDSAIDPGD